MNVINKSCHADLSHYVKDLPSEVRKWYLPTWPSDYFLGKDFMKFLQTYRPIYPILLGPMY